jgi:Kdo2-lipid IVA lauroyltransferase/acyltransferase
MIMDKLYTLSLNCFFTCIGCIPRKCNVYLSNILGDIWYAMDKRHREVAIGNLHLAYGHEKTDQEIKQLARSVFRNIARIPFEIGWSTRVCEKEFLKHFKTRGITNLLSALDKGRGALVLTAHTGNWEFLPAMTKHTGHPVNIIYKPIKSKPVNDFFYNYRTRFGAKLTPKKRAIRAVVKSLENNECVGILFDQDPGLANGVFVDFFGRLTCTSKGLAFLALKTDAPVVPVFIARKEMNYLVEFGNEIPLTKTSNREEDLIANTLAYSKALEEFIRRYPDQWFWVHRRWKRTLLEE